jgi:hypothetical protein
MKETNFPDGTLSAYLDGDVDAATQAAIEGNPELMAQVAALRAADDDLARRLGNRPKPTLLQIGEAALGIDDVDLAREPHAQRQADLLREFWAALEPAPITKPSLLEKTRLIVAELIAGGGNQPAFAFGLRGEQDGIYSAGDYQIVIETDTDFDDPTRMMLSGLVMGVAEEALSANLWRKDASMKLTTSLDAFGNFTFDQLESGQYELLITGQSLTIHLPNLEL